LGRRPPFGLELIAAVREFPVYSLKVIEQRVVSDGGKKPVRIELSIECGLEEDAAAPKNTTTKKRKQLRGNMTVVLTVNSEMDLIDFRRIP
jgi:ATP-dependent DNA helicase HFM1/MER3